MRKSLLKWCADMEFLGEGLDFRESSGRYGEN